MSERIVDEPVVAAPTLDDLHLEAGEPVRWRRQAGARWNEGTVIQREADGSVAVRDGNGAWRSLPADRLEVRTVTKRGARRWLAVADRAVERARQAAEKAASEAAEAAEVAAEQAKLKLW